MYRIANVRAVFSWMMPFILMSVLTTAPEAASADQADTPLERQAREIYDRAEGAPAFIVHVDCGDGRLTKALRTGDRQVVQGLSRDPRAVADARRELARQHARGTLSVELWGGDHLPYIDNVVNLLVIEPAAPVSAEEVQRVLAPGGTALYRTKEGVSGSYSWRKQSKARQKTIDQWTHFLHGPDNNAVAHDTEVGEPFHIQWVAGPTWARHHNYLASISAMVSANGRVFSIVDEAPVVSMAVPARWMLVARDAFNGLVLWKRRVGPWADTSRPFRSGPTDLSRRLVAVGDSVYVTLGLGLPVTALDASTGEVIRHFASTEGAREIVVSDGVLFAVIETAMNDGTSGDGRGLMRAPPELNVAAIDTASGQLLWSRQDTSTRGLLTTTLCVTAKNVVFQNYDRLVCLDTKSGAERWYVDRPVRKSRLSWSVPTTVLYHDIVFSADCAADETSKVDWTVTARPKRGETGVGQLIAYAAEDGRELWRCAAAQGYNSPVDVLVADGLVWVSAAPNPSDTNFTEGRDPRTGEVRRQLNTSHVYDSAHHHRCYRNKATDQFLLLGRTGIEVFDLQDDQGLRNCWVRGECQYGVMPANGLLYAPPHSCGCYIQSKLNGFWALAPRRALPAADESVRYHTVATDRATKERVSQTVGTTKDGAEDWPTYRHDRGRTGRASTNIPKDVSLRWNADLKAPLSGMVVAEGRVVVASPERHLVFALDAANGEVKWSFPVGSRVDSPPTIYKGRAIFGSSDGSVYCLRLSDGQLIWRRLIADSDARTIAFGQVESVWPVTGSVLVREGVVYCTAGRSSYLDGGMLLARIDALTGQLIGSTRFDSRDPQTGAEPDDQMEDVELPGALPDVLVDDGQFVYLRDKRLDYTGNELPPTVAHLYSSVGLLDGQWWHRTYWSWGERNWGRASGWFVAAAHRPSGRILVSDEETVFGFGRRKVTSGGRSSDNYHLFRADKLVQVDQRKKLKNNNTAVAEHLHPAKVTYHWSRELSVLGRAMVLSGPYLFVAGPKRQEGRESTFSSDEPAELRVVRADDGTDVAALTLPATPVFDGAAAARGALFLALANGQVVCLGGR